MPGASLLPNWAIARTIFVPLEATVEAELFTVTRPTKAIVRAIKVN